VFRRRPRHERGAAAVEFALVMPLLLMILFGLITTGLTFSDHLSATNAAREAARYGAATSIATPGTWATSVRQRVKDVYFNAGETVNDSEICVKVINAGGGTVAGTGLSGADCGNAPAAPAGMTGTNCAVMVWLTRPQTIQLLVFPNLDFDVKAESVAYYSRDDAPCTA
jgi:Flp pilus assembly protein TadG